ncbi:NUDIX hydrolase [Dasania marina]|uniref:NUDIX hydrolase n=1 Tax=Dasania marina TaxID=471499 RepID=UPI0030D6FE3D|tara:strand:+ start:54521 stop:55096 length:576 start_codon:yes stop_codon:yes gene_type:complete
MNDNKIKLPQQRGPWLKLSSAEVYDNPWVTVTHETVTTPGGTEGIYGNIHFKNRAIVIVPVDEAGNTWLVGQHRYTLDSFSWEVPMGGGPLEVDPLLAAQRELKEETGYSASHWQQLMTLHTSNSITDEEAVVFLATGLMAGEQQLEASEGDLIRKKMPLSAAVAMALNGEVTDALSVAALLAVDRLLLAK